MAGDKDMPVVRMELNAGVFRIKTEGAVYEITVKTDSSLSQVVEKIVEQEVMPGKPAAVESCAADVVEPPGDTFYRDLSEEMLNEIGLLARQLSLTITTPINGKVLQDAHISRAGVDLENAKGQLQDVVAMTEKATMDIIDISDEIQSGCDAMQKLFAEIKQMDFADGTPTGLLDEIIVRQETIKQGLHDFSCQLFPEEDACSSPEGKPAAHTVRQYSFDLDVVFQTLYEMCTNETVKQQHIKPMRAEREAAFDVPGVLKAFAALAPQVDAEENFFNFELASILKILFQHSHNEQFKKSLKKMHQSADTIFLDRILPIEGSVREREIATPMAPARMDANSLQKLIALVDESVAYARKAAIQSGRTAMDGGSDNVCVTTGQGHQQLIDALETSDGVVQNIVLNISRVLECLSFQDLSGQRIKKILVMLSDVQIKLLSTLIWFRVKLKKKKEDHDITTGETEAFASREVDRMKALIVEESSENVSVIAPLDQRAVDRLLGELGF